MTGVDITDRDVASCDVTEYRPRRWRAYAFWFGATLAVLLILHVIACVVFGGAVRNPVFAVLFAIAVGAYLARVRGPAVLVRTSPDLLEISPTGHQPVRICWNGLAGARIRYRGPFAQLVVAPARVHAVEPTPSRLTGAIDANGRLTFRVPVGFIRPDRGTLRRDLARRAAATARR